MIRLIFTNVTPSSVIELKPQNFFFLLKKEKKEIQWFCIWEFELLNFITKVVFVYWRKHNWLQNFYKLKQKISMVKNSMFTEVFSFVFACVQNILDH